MLKGDKCVTKCTLDKRPQPPGPPPARRRKLSDRALQLREKQKARITYGVLENKYLAENASTTKYEATITVTDADSWSYDTTTTLKMAKLGGKEMAHTDRNEMHRVAE